MKKSVNQNSGLHNLSKAIDESMNSKIIEHENPFPVDVFPRIFKDLAEGLYTTLNFPIDYTGTAILSAISSVIGTTVKVKVRPGWEEYGSLYACIVGNAGANKSYPLSTIFRPLKELDQVSHDEYVKKMKAFIAYSNLSAKKREESDPVTEPVLTKMVLTNFTPEILNKRLNDNPRGCVVLSDEMASFFEGMNNYSKNDNSSNYLSFWSNQSTTIDRVKEKIPLLIPTPYLCIIGGIQPRILKKVFKIEKINSGFFQRFLFAYPKHIYKKPINDEELNPKLMIEYSDYIKNYVEQINSEKAKTTVLEWTKEAKDHFFKWQANNCEIVNQNPGTIVSEIATKYDNHFVRLALIIQMMSDSTSKEITLESVKASKKLCQYFMKCAFEVLSKIQNPKNHIEDLSENKKLFYHDLQNEFTTAEAVSLADKFGIKERRAKEFLNDSKLFTKIKHGLYRKNNNTNQDI